MTTKSSLITSKSHKSKTFMLIYIAYKILIFLSPNNQKLYIKGAKHLIKLGQYRKGLDLIEELEPISQGKKRQLAIIRNLYRRSGEREQSLRVSKELADLEPRDIEVARELASDLIALNQVKRGIELGVNYHLITKNEASEGLSALSNVSTGILTNETKKCLQILRVFPHFDDKNFNCRLENLTQNTVPTVCVIHVGKCAGGSVLSTLSKTFSKCSTRIVEYHVFDANHILKKAIRYTSQSEHIHWVILTRDPASRWISSFNWDYYTYVLKKRFFCHSKALKLFDSFNNSLKLAREIAKGNEQAILLSKFEHLTCGHMAMGQAWYLNNKLIESLPPKATSLIRTEKLNNDLHSSIARINDQFGWNEEYKDEPLRDKTDYQKQYGPKIFKRLQDFNPKDIYELKKHLSEDFFIHNLLLQRFASQQ